MTSYVVRPARLFGQAWSVFTIAPSAGWLERWQERAALRRAEDRMRRLSLHTLRDIGL